MKGFSIQGNKASYISYDENSLFSTLPPAIYILQFSQTEGFYLLKDKELFDIPSTLYGSIVDKKNKILSTYKARNKNTGVLLVGTKGSGKTMLANLTANEMIAAGYPVIQIQNAFRGSSFNRIIEAIGECVIIFDEFGKLYSSNEDEQDPQDGLLSLLDGNSSGKRLFFFTENNIHLVNDFLLDRPGRIFYKFEYTKLDEQTITEVCATSLHNQTRVEEIIDFSRRTREFSFDMLQAIVEESNRYTNISIEKLLHDMNITSKDYTYYEYAVTKFEPSSIVWWNGKSKIEVTSVLESNSSLNLHFDFLNAKGSKESANIYFYRGDLEYQTKDTQIYKNEWGTLHVKITEKQFNLL